MELLIILFLALIFSFGVGKFASLRGRSGLGWGFCAFFITPLIAFILVAILPNIALEEEIEEIKENRRRKRQAEDAKLKQELKEIKEKNRVSVEAFIEQLGHVHKLYKNDLLTESEFAERKLTLIIDLKNKGITDSPDVFLSKLIDALECGFLNQEDLKSVKSQLY